MNFSYKKLSGRICLSPPGVEVAGFKDLYVSNILMYWYGKVDTPQGSTLPQLPILLKNASNKSCWALNFVQKSKWVHMSISPKRGVKDLQRLISFKCYKVLKWESRFTLGLNAAKNTDYIKKSFKEKLFWIKFSIKNLVSAYVYLSSEWRYDPSSN